MNTTQPGTATKEKSMHPDPPTEPLPPVDQGEWESRRARKRAELAHAKRMHTVAKLERERQSTTAQLPISTRLLIAFTAFAVLGVSAVVALVIIGTQIGFYKRKMH